MVKTEKWGAFPIQSCPEQVCGTMEVLKREGALEGGQDICLLGSH